MADGEPQVKKQKTEELDPVIRDILSFVKNNSFEMGRLENAFSTVIGGMNDMNLAILEVVEANPRTSVSFSYATIDTTIHKLYPGLKEPPGFRLENIFKDGIDVLRKILDKKHPRVPTDPMRRRALSNLLNFLSGNQDALFEEQKYEGIWALKLAQHLLSKLSVHGTYIVDSAPNSTLQDVGVCPCEEKDSLVGKTGDTSYGRYQYFLHQAV